MFVILKPVIATPIMFVHVIKIRLHKVRPDAESGDEDSKRAVVTPVVVTKALTGSSVPTCCELTLNHVQGCS